MRASVAERQLRGVGTCEEKLAEKVELSMTRNRQLSLGFGGLRFRVLRFVQLKTQDSCTLGFKLEVLGF